MTHGAARSNLALASASGRIRKMEQLAGVPLLGRHRHGVSLTPAGRAFAHHARIVLQQIESMKGELSEYSGGLKGRIRMQANASALSEFLPEALNEFLADHRGIDVDIEEKSSHEVVRSVAEGFADIGMVADIVDFGELEAYPFATDRLVLVTPRDHIFARQQRLSFRTLLDHGFVGLAATNALQQHLAQQAIQAGKPLKLRVRVGAFDAVCQMVGSGVGLAIIPETAARRCRQNTPISISSLSDPWAMRQLHVCVRRSSELTAPARLLLEHLHRHRQSQPTPARAGRPRAPGRGRGNGDGNAAGGGTRESLRSARR
ncbi:MAG TPA: LysR substrate-binding domain-containing protein [Acetobacteraceae bacterium]|nr:LysR substrate-binding domain-containing protein [Acetobacteraceae bacterium]